MSTVTIYNDNGVVELTLKTMDAVNLVTKLDFIGIGASYKVI